MNQLSPVGSHQTDPFTSQDEQQIAAIAGMVNQTARETEARITALEAAIRDAGKAIINLAASGIKAVSRIEKLEKQVARHAAEAIANLSVASVEQGQRIEKLEAALREVAPWLA